jgi:hypothetical protein
VLAAILGNEADPGGHRGGGRVSSQPASGQAHRSGVVGIDAEDRAGDLAAAGADEAGQRDHLAGADLERDVHEHALSGQALDLEHGGARPVGLVLARQHVPADHRSHEVVTGEPFEFL